MINRKKGFTVVELIIMIVLIGILAALGTTSLLRTQLVGRDKKRIDDVNTIAITLESTYRNGQPDGFMVPTGDFNLTAAAPMGYPSTALISTPNDAQSRAIIGVIDPSALKSPLKKTSSLLAATSNTILTNTAVTATSANDSYIYQPLDSTGALCTTANSGNAAQTVIAPRLVDSCVSFNLYYMSEAQGIWLIKKSVYRDTNGL